MKKILLLLFISTAVIACKKESSTNASGLFGKWELTAVHGGLSSPRAVDAGSGDLYEFKSDSTFTRYQDNKITNKGKFSVRFDEERNGTKFGMIYFTGTTTYKDAFQIRPSTILVGSSAADGPSYEYKKIK
jgi:hypothetical protein